MTTSNDTILKAAVVRYTDDLLARIEALAAKVAELHRDQEEDRKAASTVLLEMITDDARTNEVLPEMPEDYDINVRYEGNGISILPGLGRDHPKGIYYALVGKGHISEYREGFGTTRVAAIKDALEAKDGE